MTSIVVVDDHAAIRAGLLAMIEPEPGLEVVATAAAAGEGLAAVKAHGPGIVLVDLHLPDEDGLRLCLRCWALEPAPRTVIYSASADATLAVLAAVAGARTVLAKSTSPDGVLAVLHAVAEDRPVARSLGPDAMGAVAAALEPEDVSILGMLLHDTPPVEIATTLGITEERLQARRWGILRRAGPRRPRAEVVGATAP